MAEIAGSPAKYLAVFNIGDAGQQELRVNWSDLGLPAQCSLRDLWAKKDIGTVHAGRSFPLAPHAAAIYKLTPM